MDWLVVQRHIYKLKKRRGTGWVQSYRGGTSVPAEFTVTFPASKQTEEGVLEGSTRKTFIHQHTYVVGLYLG